MGFFGLGQKEWERFKDKVFSSLSLNELEKGILENLIKNKAITKKGVLLAELELAKAKLRRENQMTYERIMDKVMALKE